MEICFGALTILEYTSEEHGSLDIKWKGTDNGRLSVLEKQIVEDGKAN